MGSLELLKGGKGEVRNAKYSCLHLLVLRQFLDRLPLEREALRSSWDPPRGYGNLFFAKENIRAICKNGCKSSVGETSVCVYLGSRLS